MSGSRTEIEADRGDPSFSSGHDNEDGAPPKTERELLMARIAERAYGQIEEQNRQHQANEQQGREDQEAGLVPGPQNDPEEDELHYSSDQQPVRQPTSSRRQTDQAPSQQVHEIDLGGRRVTVTAEQMAHLARMGAIATQALTEYNANPQQYQQPQPQPRREAPEEIINEAVRAIQYGAPDEAEAGLAKVYAAAKRETLDEFRAEQMRATWERSVRESTPIIQQEYADVLADPIRADAAARQVAVLRQQYGNDPAIQLAIFREAGDRVRKSFGGKVPQQSRQEGGYTMARDVDGIVERKRAAPPRVASVIDRRSGGGGQEGPRGATGSQVVEAMRRARGQL